MMAFYPSLEKGRGFTLVELAVGLVIIGLLLSSIIVPLSAQQDIRKTAKTEQLLNEVNKSLLGFVSSNGRLPCPATLASNGTESISGGGDCLLEHGFVPSQTLGLYGSFNGNNLLLDAWINPIRYSLNDINSWEYGKQIPLNASGTLYQICQSQGCAPTEIIARDIVAVVYSLGKERVNMSNSPDEQENTDTDDSFVMTTRREGGTTGFDDHLLWISSNTLIYHLSDVGYF